MKLASEIKVCEYGISTELFIIYCENLNYIMKIMLF